METRIKVDDSFVYQFSFEKEDIINFSNASVDFNLIHLDKEFDEQSIFKITIIHGLLGGSVFSKIFGTMFLGN